MDNGMPPVDHFTIFISSLALVGFSCVLRLAFLLGSQGMAPPCFQKPSPSSKTDAPHVQRSPTPTTKPSVQLPPAPAFLSSVQLAPTPAFLPSVQLRPTHASMALSNGVSVSVKKEILSSLMFASLHRYLAKVDPYLLNGSGELDLPDFGSAILHLASVLTEPREVLQSQFPSLQQTPGEPLLQYYSRFQALNITHSFEPRQSLEVFYSFLHPPVRTHCAALYTTAICYNWSIGRFVNDIHMLLSTSSPIEFCLHCHKTSHPSNHCFKKFPERRRKISRAISSSSSASFAGVDPTLLFDDVLPIRDSAHLIEQQRLDPLCISITSRHKSDPQFQIHEGILYRVTFSPYVLDCPTSFRIVTPAVFRSYILSHSHEVSNGGGHGASCWREHWWPFMVANAHTYSNLCPTCKSGGVHASWKEHTPFEAFPPRVWDSPLCLDE